MTVIYLYLKKCGSNKSGISGLIDCFFFLICLGFLVYFVCKSDKIVCHCCVLYARCKHDLEMLNSILSYTEIISLFQ